MLYICSSLIMECNNFYQLFIETHKILFMIMFISGNVIFTVVCISILTFWVYWINVYELYRSHTGLHENIIGNNMDSNCCKRIFSFKISHFILRNKIFIYSIYYNVKWIIFYQYWQVLKMHDFLFFLSFKTVEWVSLDTNFSSKESHYKELEI